MPLEQSDIDELKAWIDAVEIPWLPWITDPAHPDFGTPESVQERVMASGAVINPSGWYDSAFDRSLIRHFTSADLEKYPRLCEELNVDRATRDIGVWNTVWANHRTRVQKWRDSMTQTLDDYVGTDMVEDGDKIYDADNPIMGDIIFKRVLVANKVPEPGCHIGRRRFPHLMEIPEHVRKMAQMNDEHNAVMKQFREMEFKRYSETVSPLPLMILVSVVAAVFVAVMVAAGSS